MGTAVATSVGSLPPELFYEIVIDLLTQYLHFAILQLSGENPWNAFTVLPLVSRIFHSFSASFFVKLFGENSQEDIDFVTRKERFAASKALWAKANVYPCPPWNLEAENFSPEEIPRPKNPLVSSSLLGVYDLTSRARFFFNSEAVHVESEDPMCHLRLWCPFMGQALRMCDYIFPRRLLKFVGAHLAEQTTHCYSHECVHHVKVALENLLKSPGFFDTESYVSQNLDSLKGLEENNWCFLWLGGIISQTFPMTITPTRQMIESANILGTLLAVSTHDWEDKSLDLPTRARNLHRIYTTRIQAV